MSVSLVGSTNWHDDYLYKLDEYEALGIREYWIVEQHYLTVGAIRYISSPNPPPVSVYILISDKYQLQQFRGRDRILSITFPELAVTESNTKSCLATPDSSGQMPFAPTVWPVGNRGCVTRIWYKIFEAVDF